MAFKKRNELVHVTSSSINSIFSLNYRIINSHLEHLICVSSSLLSALIGILTVFPKKFKSLEKFTIILTLMQTFIGFLKIIVQLILDFSNNNISEPANMVNHRKFIKKYKCIDYDTIIFPYSILIDKNEFLKFLVSKYKILDAYADNSSNESSLSKFLQEVSIGKNFHNYLIAIEIDKVIFIFEFKNSSNELQVYGTENSSDTRNNISTMMNKLIVKFMETLKDKFLTIKGQLWDGYEFLNITSHGIKCPEFYNINTKNKLQNIITSSISNKDKSSILMYGPPGVGKTSTILAAIYQYPALLIKIDYVPSDVLISFLEKIEGIPKILVFEDIDIESKNSDKTPRIQSILHLLDSNCYDIAIITTNSLNLPSSLLRSGRCDIRIQFNKPNETESNEIIQKLNHKFKVVKSISDLIDIKPLIRNFSHADLYTACKNARIYKTTLLEYLPEFNQEIKSLNEYKDR